jgi:hypothetical protein
MYKVKSLCTNLLQNNLYRKIQTFATEKSGTAERVNIYRKALSSHGRVVTYEDIKELYFNNSLDIIALLWRKSLIINYSSAAHFPQIFNTHSGVQVL